MTARGARTALSLLLVAAGATFVPLLFLAADDANALGFDLVHACLDAADRVIHGESPYTPPEQWAALDTVGYVYPPLTAFLTAPLLLVSANAAGWAGAAICLAAVLGAALLVGVRDLRCHALIVLSAPTVFAVHDANISALVCLLAALTWRLRTQGWWAAGSAVALKLFAWPLVVWLAFTRGLRHATLALVLALTVTIVTWGAIGFAGLTGYPDLLARLTEFEEGRTYGISSLGIPLDGPIALALGAAALWAAWKVRRDEIGALAFCLAAALAVSPIVWIHYFVLLVVPLGLRRPTLSPSWFLLLAFWLLPGTNPPDVLDRVVAYSVVGGLLVWTGLGAPVPSRLRWRARKGVLDPATVDG